MKREERLIKLIREHKYLYDKNDICFKDNKLKNTTWENIALEVHMEVDVVKRKWKTLRDRYSRTQKQCYLAKECGSEKQNNYKYADILSFLDKCPLSCTRLSLKYENTTNIASLNPYPYTCDLLEDVIRKQSSDETEPTAVCSDLQIYLLNELHNDNESKFSVFEQNMSVRPNKENNRVSRRCATKANLMKSKEQLFCENLELQLREANMSDEMFSKFQLDVYTAFYTAIKTKSKNHILAELRNNRKFSALASLFNEEDNILVFFPTEREKSRPMIV